MKWLGFSVLALVAAAAEAAPPKSVRQGIEAWQQAHFADAVAIWRPLAEKGDADAAFNLAQAYRLGRGVPVDRAAAEKWLSKAAAAGHLDAQTTLGLLLFDSGRRDTALEWLQKAAARGEPRAMLVYGTALFNGDGVPRDPVMAYAYVTRAAGQGLEPAKATLQQMDQVLPLDARQKALAIATKEAKPAPAPQSKPAKVAATPPAPAKPAPKSEPAAPAVAASGSWRIQLGAFSKRASAEALYHKLSGRLGGRQAFYVAAGAVTRLQVGPYATKAAAAAACAAVSGQPCFPVSAK